MAAGETSGRPRPRRIISAGGCKRRPEGEEGTPPGTTDDGGTGAPPVIKEADPDLERLLAEEEEIERRLREQHETPHFRSGDE